MTALESERDRLVAGFGELAGALAEGSPAWLPPLRAAAMERFEALGFPSRKREDWKYTNIAPIARALAEANFDAAAVARDEIDAVISGLPHSLVFVNGRLAPEATRLPALPDGAVVGGLAQALKECPGLVEPHWKQGGLASGRALVALNSALQRDGAFVSLPRNVRLEEPIQLVFITAGAPPGATAHLRNLVVLAEGAEASVVERHISLDGSAGLANVVSEIFLAADSRLDHVLLEVAGERATHLQTCFARLQANARFRSHVILLGAALTRSELEVVLAGPGSECDLSGLYVASGDRHVDNQTVIDHAAPHCTSRELYKGVLDGHSRGVFNGKVIVRPNAQKTHAVQSNPNLILSDGAEVDTRPNLEIHADDVKCSHGATIGRLDDDALFFLRARGIGEDQARQMLCRAFGAEVIATIPSARLREEIHRYVARVFDAVANPT